MEKKIRYKVLEMDPKGNLYLHKTAILCKNEIVKRLVNDTYQLVESNPIGESRWWFNMQCNDFGFLFN